MAAKSKIEWTGRTWNPITGCSKISPGCENCYALRMSERLQKIGIPNYQGIVKRSEKGTLQWTNKINLDSKKISQPLHWRESQIVFVNSMSDLFHESVPFIFIRSLFIVMQESDNHIFQILTKRPDRMLQFLESKQFPIIDGGSLRDNKHIWLGTSIENQKTADERLPFLSRIPDEFLRIISCEPLLEEIDLSEITRDGELFNPLSGFGDLSGYTSRAKRINWVIVGGERTGKRYFNPDWARSIKAQCRNYHVPFFMKQIDKIRPIPKDLQIREVPETRLSYLFKKR